MTNNSDGNAITQLTASAERLINKTATRSPRTRSDDDEGIESLLLPTNFSLEFSAPNFLSNTSRWVLMVIGGLVLAISVIMMFVVIKDINTQNTVILTNFIGLDQAKLAAIGESSAQILTTTSFQHNGQYLFFFLAIASMIVCVLAVLGYGSVKIGAGKEKESNESDVSKEQSATKVEIEKIDPTDIKIVDKMPFTITGVGFHKDLNLTLKKSTLQISEISYTIGEGNKTLSCTFNKSPNIAAGDWTLVIADNQSKNPEKPIEKPLKLID
jgi:hypothetical protein